MWGQSQDKGKMSESRKQSPTGMFHISISLVLMGTSKDASVWIASKTVLLEVKMCLRIQAMVHWLLRPSYGKPLQTFVGLLTKRCSISSFSRGGVWRGRKTRINVYRTICTYSQYYTFVHLLHHCLLYLTHTMLTSYLDILNKVNLSYSYIVASW